MMICLHLAACRQPADVTLSLFSAFFPGPWKSASFVVQMYYVVVIDDPHLSGGGELKLKRTVTLCMCFIKRKSKV
jgi:hypothetical protein